jgi:hypothetical protein
VSVKTQAVLDSITDISKDPDRVRWTLPEIARWLNHGAGQVATIHPRAASQYVTLSLAAGARQDLRTIDATKSWIRLHELVCNATAAGAPTGDTIRHVARAALSNAVKTWRSLAASATAVKEYTQDEREAFTFDVYPPVAAGTKVLALASMRPAPFCILNGGNTGLLDNNETVPLADGYDIPLIDYALFRMFSKDTNDPSYAARAALHLQAFQLAMGIETKDAKPE